MAHVVWFRSDLRVDDHRPLRTALASGEPTVPVVCVDLDLARRTQFGIPRLGPHRARFWMECIGDLRLALRALGSDLVVLRGRPTDVLIPFAERVGAKAVHFHRGFAADEQTEERALQAKSPQMSWNGVWGNLLATPNLAPFAVSDVPETFTLFRKKVEARVEIPEPLAAPAEMGPVPSGIEVGEVPSLDELGLAEPEPDPRAVTRFRGGSTAGRARVRHYFWAQDRLRVYKETRNGMLAPDDSSKLSAWLAHGALSPRWILREVKRYERERVSNDSTYWLVFELLWRDYFQYIALKHGARLFKQGGLRGLRFPWRRQPELIAAWREGKTGYPLIDASMRELAATGYTSNRARQNVASFFTKVLGQDWRIGAAIFEQLLVDYDPASNWGNWAYNAGVGNDARGFRYFHIPKQTRDYDPDGDFIRHWVPELTELPTEWLAEPYSAPMVVQAQAGIGARYPERVVDLAKAVNVQRRAYERANPPPPARSRRRAAG